MTKDWRTLANAAARAHNLPQGLQKAHMTVYVHKTNNRAYDVHNLYGTAKAAIDGLVSDYGLLPDDNNDHLLGPDMRHGERQDQAGITIVIQDLSDAGQT